MYYDPEYPYSDELTARANKVITDYVIHGFRLEYEKSWTEPFKHLSQCENLAFRLDTAYDGGYGCDTGCEYFRVEGEISCNHDYKASYEYGEFGGLLWSVDGLEEALKEQDE